MRSSVAQQDTYGLKVEEQLNACTNGPVSLRHLMIRARRLTIQDALYVDPNIKRIYKCG
jgi:hypothetical protein